MSTLKVTNIQATGETASRAVSGVAAAWCKIDADASTPVYFGSSGTSSLTDNSTGNYTIQFTNSMADTHYAAVGSNQRIGSTDEILNPYGYSTGSLRFDFLDDGSNADPPIISFIIHGDLA